MADAVIVTIAEAVKTALNAASLSQGFTATRKARPHMELSQLETLAVTVVPIQKLSAPTTRNRAVEQGTYLVDVGVQKKCDVSNNTVVDPLIYLVEEIGQLFVGAGQLTGYTSATCLQAEMVDGAEAGFSPEHMDTHRQFTGVARLTFKVV